MHSAYLIKPVKQRHFVTVCLAHRVFLGQHCVSPSSLSFPGGTAELFTTKLPLSFSFPLLAVRILQVLTMTGSPAVGSPVFL